MIGRVALAAVLFPLLLLGGCATQDARPVPDDRDAAWQLRLKSLDTLDRWDLRARIAVRVGDDGGQANLHWTRQQHRNDLRLVGVWGKGLLRLNFDGKQAELTDEYGQVRTGPDAGELLYEATGWVIPVSSLNAWMAGRPVSAEAETRLDQYGRLARIVEAGWEVEYQEYQQFGQWELPRRLKLSQKFSINAGRAVSLRMVVNSWQVER